MQAKVTGARCRAGNRASSSCRSAFRVAREQAAEVVIAARRFNVEQQRLVAHAHLSAEDRFDARLLCRLHELHRAVQVAGVREGDSGQAVLFCQFDNGRGRERGIEKRIVAVHAKRNVNQDEG